MVCNTNKIVINKSKLYYYFQRQGSILNGAKNDNGWNNFFEGLESIVKLGISINNKIFTIKATDCYLGALLNRSMELYTCDKNEYINCKKKYNKAFKKYILKLGNLKSIFIYSLFYVNIYIYLTFKKIKNM